MAKKYSIHTQFESSKKELLDFLHHFESQGEDVVKGERNSIKKVSINGTVFNVKRFKTPTFFQGLVYQFLRKSKARRSYEYAMRLIDCKIKTPFPVGYFEHTAFGLKESYYISEHLAYDFDFRVLNHNPKWPDREEILKQVAHFTFQLHENNINFLDHSPGNTLIKKIEDGAYDFYLIDLNRMRFEKMNLDARMHNFRRLWLSKTMINIMAPVYATLYGSTPEDTHRLMTFYSRRFQKKVNAKKVRKRRRRR